MKLNLASLDDKSKDVIDKDATIEIGNKVKIVDSGKLYSGHKAAAKELGATKWNSYYGKSTPLIQDMVGIVKNIKFSKKILSNEQIALVYIPGIDEEFVIGVKGLAKVIQPKSSTPDDVGFGMNWSTFVDDTQLYIGVTIQDKDGIVHEVDDMGDAKDSPDGKTPYITNEDGDIIPHSEIEYVNSEIKGFEVGDTVKLTNGKNKGKIGKINSFDWLGTEKHGFVAALLSIDGKGGFWGTKDMMEKIETPKEKSMSTKNADYNVKASQTLYSQAVSGEIESTSDTSNIKAGDVVYNGRYWGIIRHTGELDGSGDETSLWSNWSVKWDGTLNKASKGGTLRMDIMDNIQRVAIPSKEEKPSEKNKMSIHDLKELKAGDIIKTGDGSEYNVKEINPGITPKNYTITMTSPHDNLYTYSLASLANMHGTIHKAPKKEIKTDLKIGDTVKCSQYGNMGKIMDIWYDTGKVEVKLQSGKMMDTTIAQLEKWKSVIPFKIGQKVKVINTGYKDMDGLEGQVEAINPDQTVEISIPGQTNKEFPAEKLHAIGENKMINPNIKKLFEARDIMYNKIELGSKDSDKRKLYKYLQDLAFDRGMILNKNELKDQASGNVLVDKNSDNPLKHILNTLDLSSIIDEPARSLTIQDLEQAVETKSTAILDKEKINNFSLLIKTVPDQKDINIKGMLQVLNNVFETIEGTVTNLGTTKGEFVHQLKMQVSVPSTVSKDKVVKLVQDNIETLKSLKIKTIDIFEGY